MKRHTFVTSFVVATFGCVDVGQELATLPLYVAGTAIEGPIGTTQGWSIEITRAELAFGPLYLCPGFQAGSLCDTARVEWLESAVVDTLDPKSHNAGTLNGVTGPVRSWMYDLGFTSLLTQQKPVALAAAEALNGNSVRLEGRARKDAYEVPFVVELAVQQEEETEVGVSVVRKSGGERFEHEITGAQSALTVRFDPRPWFIDVDFNELVEETPCSPGGAPIVCAATSELRCSSDGATLAQRDCTAEGLTCLRAIGCIDRAQLPAESQAARAVRNALAAGTRPTFEWATAR